ncbi:MAG TPA: NF038122 family metalloprotease [Rhizomicrobium sp.]
MHFPTNPIAHPEHAATTGGFHINLIYDSAALAAPQSFRDGVQAAANMLESVITDNITVNINIDYSGTGGGASAGPDAGLWESYSSIRSDLTSAASPGDHTFDDLPSGSTIDNHSKVLVWNAQLKLFGLLSANDTTTDDGSVTFAKDIDPSLLVGVALHELTHALGRVPAGVPDSTVPDIFDFFRFTSPGNILIDDHIPASASAYFSIDGGNTKLADYGVDSDPSDFLNTGVQGPNDPFNEFYGKHTLQTLTSIDLEQLDALGFHVNTGAPDLTASGAAFKRAKLAFSVNNTGSGVATPSVAGIFLSSQTNVTTSGTLVGTVSIPSLAVGDSASELASLALPTDLTPGKYYLAAIANFDGSTAESNSANDTSNAVPVLLGNDSANTLTGTTAADTVFGFSGADRLNGGGGADILVGGTGNDIYVVNNKGVAIVEDPNAGTDTVKTNLSSYTLANNLEKLVYTGTGNFTGTGNALNNTITGGAGNDTFKGLGGADHLVSGGGSDTFYYGSASDSTGRLHDTITGFDASHDTFDVPGSVSAINKAIVSGTLSTSTFDADLANAVNSHHLSANHAVLFTPSSGGLKGDLFLVVDVNGVAGYQAGQDLVILLDHPTNMTHFGVWNFI